jgi:hypothetical protein
MNAKLYTNVADYIATAVKDATYNAIINCGASSMKILGQVQTRMVVDSDMLSRIDGMDDWVNVAVSRGLQHGINAN